MGLTSANVGFCGCIGDSEPRPRFAQMSARNVTTSAEAADMAFLVSAPAPAAGADEPFDRVARLAALVMGAPSASITFAVDHPISGTDGPGVPEGAGWRSPVERSLGRQVIDSGNTLVIEDTRVDPGSIVSGPAGPGEPNGLENELRLCCTPEQAASRGAPRTRPIAVRRVAPGNRELAGGGPADKVLIDTNLGSDGPTMGSLLLTDRDRPGLQPPNDQEGGFRHIVGE